VSLVVPDTPEFANPSVHPLGIEFMRNVLIGLAANPVAKVESFSAEPMPSFPRGQRLLVRGRVLQLSHGTSTSTVTYLNVTPFKQFHIGFSILSRLIGWGIRTRRKQHRVIFSFNLSVPHLAFTVAAAYLTGARPLVWISDVNVPGETVPNGVLLRLDAWMGRKMLKFVRGGIVVSDAIAKKYLPSCSCIRIDGGVSLKMVEETGRLLAFRRPAQDRFTIVATGSLTAFNGFREILDAFSRLEEPQYKLIVAGQGPLQCDVEAAARHDPRIEFRGFVDHQAVLALQAEADVLVSMRVTKAVNTAYAFPSKTFEYLLSGVPVITTATGHMKAEYGPYCFILEDESAEALATLIQSVQRLSSAERTRIGLTARKFITDCKTWEAQHGRIAEYVRLSATG
jgi:glycosyltransferase involved in cell wall biosynthesis